MPAVSMIGFGYGIFVEVIIPGAGIEAPGDAEIREMTGVSDGITSQLLTHIDRCRMMSTFALNGDTRLITSLGK